MKWMDDKIKQEQKHYVIKDQMLSLVVVVMFNDDN